jgi:hypothetical protein
MIATGNGLRSLHKETDMRKYISIFAVVTALGLGYATTIFASQSAVAAAAFGCGGPSGRSCN